MQVSGRYVYKDGTNPASNSFLNILAMMVADADKLPPEELFGIVLLDLVGEGGGVG